MKGKQGIDARIGSPNADNERIVCNNLIAMSRVRQRKFDVGHFQEPISRLARPPLRTTEH